jgi:uncharacterized membrane protein (TIGR02234 family)
VLLAAAGGAVALLAASRNWVITETPRPDPLPPVREELSGRDTVPWATAMAFVALAGGLALLATRRIGRLVVGVVLGLAGAVMIAGAFAGWTTTGTPPERVEVHALWPAVTLIGGMAALAAGVLAVARGRRWAAMGAKYEAPGVPREPADDAPGIWDALDRGEDPTER